MEMLDCFRDLLALGSDIGRVESAHMYDDNYCSIEGIGNGGNKFTLSLSVKRELVCEKNNEEENEND